MTKRAYQNLQSATELPANAPKDAVKIEFARRLQAAMVAKGMQQSDLARSAQIHLPKDKRFGRDSISLYIRAKSLPGPLHLKALCAALGRKPEELLPTRGIPSAGENTPTFDARDLGDGNTWLRINQAVPWNAAIEIMRLVKGAN
mgnify:CR=1 FL=1